jgi:hypothetical protein
LLQLQQLFDLIFIFCVCVDLDSRLQLFDDNLELGLRQFTVGPEPFAFFTWSEDLLTLSCEVFGGVLSYS